MQRGGEVDGVERSLGRREGRGSALAHFRQEGDEVALAQESESAFGGGQGVALLPGPSEGALGRQEERRSVEGPPASADRRTKTAGCGSLDLPKSLRSLW